jgi:hypothetical protein
VCLSFVCGHRRDLTEVFKRGGDLQITSLEYWSGFCHGDLEQLLSLEPGPPLRSYFVVHRHFVREEKVDLWVRMRETGVSDTRETAGPASVFLHRPHHIKFSRKANVLRALSQHVATMRAKDVGSPQHAAPSAARSNSRFSSSQCWSVHAAGTWLGHRLRLASCLTPYKSDTTLRLSIPRPSVTFRA